MAPIYKQQSSFTGGEFSPSLQSRSDLQKYASGLKRAKNFIIHPYGGASRRPGTRYVAAAKPGARVRLIPFQVSEDVNYVIEFGNLYLRFYRDGLPVTCGLNNLPATLAGDINNTYDNTKVYRYGDIVSLAGVLWQCNTFEISGNSPSVTYWFVVTTATIYEIPTEYTSGMLSQLNFAQSVDTLFITHPDKPPMTLIRFFGQSSVVGFHLYAFASLRNGIIQFPAYQGPFQLQNTDQGKTIDLYLNPATHQITLTSHGFYFPMAGLDDGYYIKIIMDYVAFQSITNLSTLANGSVTVLVATQMCGTSWRISTGGTFWNGTIYIDYQDDNGFWVNKYIFASSGIDAATNNAINTFITVNKPTRIKVTLGLNSKSADAVLTFSIDGFTGETALWVNDVGELVTVVTGRPVSPSFSLDTKNGIIDWAIGSWGKLQGYPTAVEFYQGRLIFGGTKLEPDAVWASQLGNYNDFSRSSPLLDTDSISVRLASRKYNGVKFLVALNDIVVLTNGSESTVGASGGVFTPTSVEVKQQGNRGSADVTPIIIGNRIVYVQSSSAVVRDLAFDFQPNAYVGEDLTTYSNHLFRGYTLTECAYQQTPDSIAWFIRNDGVLLSMTYLREQEVLAWSWHDTVGQFDSICTIPHPDGYDEVWVSVLRNGLYYIERMDSPYPSGDVEDSYFVDCGITYNHAQNITAITQANPAVVTIVAHGLADGSVISIEDVLGMTELNNKKFVIAVLGVDTFSLLDLHANVINSTGYTAYISGGIAQLCPTTLIGLDRLNGLAVSMLADGVVKADQVVIAGQADVDYPAATVHVGLPYTSDLVTLNLDMQLRDGTMQSRKARIIQVAIDFLNTRGGKIGTDDDNLDSLHLEAIDGLLEIPNPLFNGKSVQTLNSNFDRGASVFYRQSEPLPATIISIIPIFNPGGT